MTTGRGLMAGRPARRRRLRPARAAPVGRGPPRAGPDAGRPSRADHRRADLAAVHHRHQPGPLDVRLRRPRLLGRRPLEPVRELGRQHLGPRRLPLHAGRRAGVRRLRRAAVGGVLRRLLRRDDRGARLADRPDVARPPRLPADPARAVPREHPPVHGGRDRRRLPLPDGLGVHRPDEGLARCRRAVVRVPPRMAPVRDRGLLDPAHRGDQLRRSRRTSGGSTSRRWSTTSTTTPATPIRSRSRCRSGWRCRSRSCGGAPGRTAAGRCRSRRRSASRSSGSTGSRCSWPRSRSGARTGSGGGRLRRARAAAPTGETRAARDASLRVDVAQAASGRNSIGA